MKRQNESNESEIGENKRQKIDSLPFFTILPKQSDTISSSLPKQSDTISSSLPNKLDSNTVSWTRNIGDVLIDSIGINMGDYCLQYIFTDINDNKICDGKCCKCGFYASIFKKQIKDNCNECVYLNQYRDFCDLHKSCCLTCAPSKFSKKNYEKSE